MSLSSKLCVEVWRTGHEFSLNAGKENWKLQMETPKFPAKIDFSFHWRRSGLETETSDFGPDFLFLFLNRAQPCSVDSLNQEGLCDQRYERR